MVILALAGGTQAAVITAAGVDADLGEGWRSTSVAKQAFGDPDGDGVYGSDGYYVTGYTAGSTLPNSGAGNPPIIFSLPSYIAGVTPSGATIRYFDSGYAPLDDPTQPVSASVANMSGDSPQFTNQNATGMWFSDSDLTYFTIQLAADQAFVLTVLVDTGNPVGTVTVNGPGPATATQPIVINGSPGYAFFNIQGAAGDTFTVALTKGSHPYTSSSGLAFEAITIPEPASLGLIGSGVMLLMARRRSRQ